MMKLKLIKALSTSRSLSSASLVAFLGLWLFLGAGCAMLNPPLKDPAITITSVTLLSAQSLTPQFEIGLHVVNPNAQQLNVRGVTYKIFLNEREVVQGAANNLPVVPAYGEADLNVIANVGLMEAMGILKGMLTHTGGQVAYRVQANLDVGALYPMIKIEKLGNIAP
jgi:LEA14-like dessication related protein